MGQPSFLNKMLNYDCKCLRQVCQQSSQCKVLHQLMMSTFGTSPCSLVDVRDALHFYEKRVKKIIFQSKPGSILL